MRPVTLLPFALMLLACDDAGETNRIVGELASDRIELVAESAEPITQIWIAEGAAVKAGDLLVSQDPTRTAARLHEAEAALREALGRLDELVRGPRSERIAAARASLDGAEKDLVFRQAEYERTREVAARDLASPEALDRAKAELDAAVAAVDLRRAELAERLSGTTVEELTQAEASVEQARARRNAAQVDLERLEIRAPVDGIADSRLFETGERPAAGQPVLVLLAGNQVHARVYVPERLRVRVQPGSRATLYVDGYAAPLAGTVRWVASEAAYTPYYALTEHDRGRLSYAAKIDIDDVIERLPDGVPLEAELHLDAGALP
ncbi:MAG: HlyD family efflux transporter periplasmic adaptor subunit [Pseudomonadota bacterium]